MDLPGPRTKPVSGTYRLEGVREGHHGEEVGDKAGTAVPVIEVRVGHQCGPDGGTHKLLQGERSCQGTLHSRDLCDPVSGAASFLTCSGKPWGPRPMQPARLAGPEAAEKPLAGKPTPRYGIWQQSVDQQEWLGGAHCVIHTGGE